MKKHLHISRLLAGCFAQNLTKKETDELNQWLKSDPLHPEMMEKIVKNENIAESIKAFQKYNTTSDLFALHQNIQLAYNRKRFSYLRLMKYAAILILPLALAAYLLFLGPFDLVKKQPIAINHGIKKARLIVKPDLVFDLEKNKNLLLDGTDIKVENKDGSLVYSKLDERKAVAPVEEIHTLVVPRGGEWELKLSDGTKVWVNAESELKFPKQFFGDSRMVELVSGEAYFEVEHNTGQPFLVKSAIGVVEVLGTAFNIRSYKEESKNITTLVEGKVKLTHTDQRGETVVLQAGDQAVIIHGDPQINVNQVKTSYYTAWKDKLFAFNKEPLSYIMANISRWYDVDIYYEDEEAKDFLFSARLGRYENVESLIEKIEMTKKVTIEISNKGLEISKYKR